MSTKNKSNNIPHEDAYFAEQDRALLERLREERTARITEEERREGRAERERLKAVHWMRCPKCGHEMNEELLNEILVDICTSCEGIYFDRGELEDLFTKQQSQAGFRFFRKVLLLGRTK